METYPFYDFLLVVFGISCICVSIFAGYHENPKRNYRFGSIFLRILGVCFGVLWIILPRIYHKMGIYAPIHIEMLYSFWGFLPAFIGSVVCAVLVWRLLLFVLWALEWARFTMRFKKRK
jgi:hypothetical protein